MSHGSLGLSEDLQFVFLDGQLVVSWNPTGSINRGPRDRVMILAYNIEAGWAKEELSGSRRDAGSHSISLMKEPPGTYHIYAAFGAEDGSRQSDSRYLGVVMNSE